MARTHGQYVHCDSRRQRQTTGRILCHETYTMKGNLKKRKSHGSTHGPPNCDWPKTHNGEEQTSRPITSSADEGIKPDCAKVETADSRKLRFKIGKKFRIGTWNVRSMKAGTLSTVIKEVRRNKIIICGIAEHRWSGKGHFTPPEGGKIMYSGGDKSRYGGVAVSLDKDCINMMLGYNPVNDRIMSVRLKGTAHDLTIIQTYAPTTQASEEERESFYDCLQQRMTYQS
ncbi:craniofacial development protein 2 [Elysia marginata]|uniref:Craniofacial development protein 2 n=1 Tax=Elysia marginata TaxID=1093978 RepID=A0AAV4EU80_9GAST|nr:craniofacial development protein 2 [Elysia marginata]